MLSDRIISAIRTWVPAGVGLLLTWLASTLHVVIDPSSQAGLVALCTAVLTSVYYLAARSLERLWPPFGWLLGAATQPTYATKAADGAYVITDVSPASQEMIRALTAPVEEL
jgi:hypothetical protein